MARSRNIKPGFFKNEKLASLPAMDRLLFAGLWTVADREGRFEVRLQKIKGEVFPHEQVMLESCMEQLWHKDFICFYEVGNKHYGQVNNWERHQSPHHKEVDSILPAISTEKTFIDQKDIHAWLKHESCMNHTRFKESGSSPLIPDSLNLIPDTDASPKVDVSELFERFYLEYPKKKSRGQAEKAFAKLKPTDVLVDEMVAALGKAKKSEDWKKEKGQFIPYPASWLTAKGWEDEIESSQTTGMQW
jgi:hypothetical protein